MDNDLCIDSLYDYGFRRGTFDKCNGQPPRDVEGWGDIAVDGYNDGYNNNNVRIFYYD